MIDFSNRLTAVVASFCLAATTAGAATFTVTNSAASGSGSLQDALARANTSAAPNSIVFALPGPVPVVIDQSVALPIVTNAVAIDASTQPGYAINAPAIWVTTTNQGNGIRIEGSGSLVRGLRFSGFSVYGISLRGDSNRVEDCHLIGNMNGLLIEEGRGNTIGGSASSNRNVVSGNALVGIVIQNTNAVENTIQGNWIGVTATNPAAALGNGSYGIRVAEGCSNLIVGTAAARQIVSGNGASGILLHFQTARGNRIAGNHVGIDQSGFTAVPNAGNGVEIGSATDSLIGGTNAADRNILSGNTGRGVHLTTATASNTAIVGNYIGISPFGSPAVANQQDGIANLGSQDLRVVGNVIAGNGLSGISSTASRGGIVQGNSIGIGGTGSIISNQEDGVHLAAGSDWRIGGTNAADRNIIGGNAGDGVHLAGGSGIVIEGNYIGVDANGIARPNNNGIELLAVTNAVVGGSVTNARNYIAGNRQTGLLLSGGSGTAIRGNHIGVTAAGLANSNGTFGIRMIACTGMVVGGSSAAERNVISGNGGQGVYLEVNTSLVQIRGNFIGTDPAGSARLPNSMDGILLQGAQHTVGGTNAGEGNVISGNTQMGIEVVGTNHLIAGNLIGWASNGVTRLTNTLSGIDVRGAVNVTIGGSVPAARNVIDGGSSAALAFSVSDSRFHRVLGNYIGFNATGTNSAPAAIAGISVGPGGSMLVIGGTNGGEGNLISTLTFTSTFSTGVVVQGNRLGVDLQNRPQTGVTDGINISASLPGLTIGGTGPGAGNVIGGFAYGIRGGATLSNLVVQGNWIGAGTNGAPLGTLSGGASCGIYLLGGHDSLIGGTNTAAGNVIAHYKTGVLITSNRVAMLNNRIYSNSTIAIDLGGNAIVDGNDPLDADAGANEKQNSPTITNTIALPGSVLVQGYLSSAPSASYRLEFFGGDTTLPGGYAQYLLGSGPIATAANGTGTFSIVLGGTLATGKYVCATATDANNNTSEIGPAASIRLATDSDGDRMPDYWETAYGLNPAVSNGAAADADGDGFPDAAEYFANTAPNDGNALLEVTALVPTPAGFGVVFPTSAYRLYDIERGTNLLGTVWTGIASNVPGNSLDQTVFDATTTTGAFYRARARLP